MNSKTGETQYILEVKDIDKLEMECYTENNLDQEALYGSLF